MASVPHPPERPQTTGRWLNLIQRVWVWVSESLESYLIRGGHVYEGGGVESKEHGTRGEVEGSMNESVNSSVGSDGVGVFI